MRIRAGMGPGKLILESRLLYEDMAALVDGDHVRRQSASQSHCGCYLTRYNGSHLTFEGLVMNVGLLTGSGILY